MSESTNRAFGLPSIPRQSMPSMFQILGWYPPVLCDKSQANIKEQILNNCSHECQDQKKEKQIMDNPSEVKTQFIDKSPNRRSKSVTKSGIYQLKQVHLKKSFSHQKTQISGSKISQIKQIKPTIKKLDPQINEDLKQIEARKQRIKKFMYVTRDLPNSALTTYQGRPTWQVYGRANSNPNLLTHNVMPHRGQNHPKSMQSYYNALLKGKNSSLSTYVPRKPIQQIKPQAKEQHKQQIYLPLQKPDLINNIRFTAQNPRGAKNDKIPSNKITPLQRKNVNKSVRKQKKKRISPDTKKDIISQDGLKYMNTRDHLLKILEKKKTNTSKLAWKVTQCYPFQLDNQQKLKKSIKEWNETQVGGKHTTKCDTVKQLMTFYKQSPI